MTSGNPSAISKDKYDQLLLLGRERGFSFNYIPEKHQLEISDSENWLVKVFLPWNCSVDLESSLLPKDDFYLGLVMIRAGIAATGHFHNGEMLNHKVFRAYMVRKGQGKSQVKYLKTKGKSRAGSRVRLEETERFFEEINERLQQYDSNYAISLWGISCAKTLLPYFMSSETPPPFSSREENLLGIPFHVQHPDFETLQKIHRKLNMIHLLVSEEGKGIFGQLEDDHTPIDSGEDDDW